MDETHVHWNGSDPQVVDILSTAVEMYVDQDDPIGVVRVRASGSLATGVAVPTSNDWQPVPGTGLEARGDASDMSGLVRLRVAAV